MHHTLSGLASLLALVLTIPAAAQPPSSAEKKDERIICATGLGTVKVKPDMVKLSFGVLTGTATVKETRVENVKSAKRVFDALQELKIPGLEVRMVQGEMKLVKQGAGGGIGPLPGGELMPTITGYRTTTAFTVVYRDKDPDKLRETANRVLDAALDAGVNVDARGTVNDNWNFGLNGVQGVDSFIEYERQDMVEPQRQALAKAVEDALVKAKALAGGAKVNIIDTVAISDLATPTGSNDTVSLFALFYSWANANRDAPSTTFAVQTMPDGDIEITCRVTVRCRY